MRRSAKLFLATNGSSAKPGQTNRCSAITRGDRPEVTPWRAATKPSAQNSAAPAPHAMPQAVAYFGVGWGLVCIDTGMKQSACAGKELEPADVGYASLIEPHYMGRDLAHFRSDMADIDHGNGGFIAQPDQIGQDFALVSGIERGERLVQQQ